MSETAAERGRRFAARWEALAVVADAAIASAEEDWACEMEGGNRDDIGYAGQAYGEARGRPRLLRTRARWLRHAAMVEEERERDRDRWVLVALAAAFANVSAAMAEVRALDARRDPPQLHRGEGPGGLRQTETVLTARQRSAVEPAHWPDAVDGAPKVVTVEIRGHRLAGYECRDCGGSGADMGPPGYDCASCCGTGFQYE